MLQTPVILVTKKGIPSNWHYNLNENVKVGPGEQTSYMKGLGSWDTDDLKYIVEKDGIDKMFDMLDFDDDKVIDDWLGSDSEPRKKYILDNEFSIAKL